jgi:imidazolonepropionase-like amidohydrolase
VTAGRTHHRPRVTALKAGWLFDGTGAAPRAEPLVVVEGDRIRSVDFGVPPPPDAAVVDLGPVTLLPGLIDTHVHLAFDASDDPVAHLAQRSDDEVLSTMRRAGRTALVGGVTTVRDLGDRSYLSLGLRGAAEMPTLLTAGPPITTSAGHCHFLGGAARPGPAGVRAAVQERIDRGVDVIKIMASGGQLTPGSGQHRPQFSVEELQVAVEEAHRHGLRISAHAHATQGIINALAARVDGIEHASFWSEDGVDEPGDVIDQLAERRIAVGATVGLVPVPGITPPPALLKRMPMIIANLRRMMAAGVVIVAATDAGIAPTKPHDVVRAAVPQLVDFGMSPLHVLRTVTSLAAEVCGLGDRKGRIAPGFDADLLAVDGDPTTDPAAIHRITAVYHLGVAVDRDLPDP